MPYRLPAGPDQLRWAEQMGMRSVHWSIPLDYYVDPLGLGPRDAADRLISDIRPGDIILAHDARDGGTDRDLAIATLRLLLPALERRGFEVTTVSDLLGQGDAVRAEPRTWFWQTGFTCP